MGTLVVEDRIAELDRKLDFIVDSLTFVLLEKFVVMEMRKQSSWSKTEPELYYWRTVSGQEVDIVLEDSTGQLVGIEVKAGATLQREQPSRAPDSGR